MKEKTKYKLEKRRQNLPLHYIDACVVMESLMLSGDEHVSCERYLNKVGYRYKKVISISALGEFFVTTVKKIEKRIDRETTFIFLSNAFTFVRELMNRGKITLLSPQFKTYPVVEKIKMIESRVEPMDALNHATAIADGANVFVTIDNDLVENKKLESAFRIKIKHSGELYILS